MRENEDGKEIKSSASGAASVSVAADAKVNPDTSNSNARTGHNILKAEGDAYNNKVGDTTNNVCTILMVKNIEYDNPLLNNIELFNYTADVLGADKVLSLGVYLDNCLIQESIQTGDYNLALAGLVSLEQV